jgi:hypothetical protein
MDITNYIARAKEMRAVDQKRDSLFAGIDDMWHGTWSLPEGLKKKNDMREVIDLSPHDALKSGSAILSTSMPHWTVQPLVSNMGEQERAEKIEYAIDYNYRRMNKRGSSTILWDMVHSCLRYDAIAVWLDYLPYQFGKSPTLRQKHALRGGDFVGVVHNPRNVHVQKDIFGINCVLLATNLTAQEVVSKWGDRADLLKSKLDEMADDGTARFVYNDLMLYENDSIKRVVWGNIAEGYEVNDSSGEFVIMDEEIDTPFMPWIVRVGGSGLEILPEYSVHPLLSPLYHTHKWQDLNAFQSILQSEIIKYGRTPRVKTSTMSGDGVDIDYDDGSTINLSVGQDAEAWKPAPIDSNLKELVDRVRADVSSTTLPRILQNPEFAGNTPFASINAMIQTALGGLNPAKTLCESAHEELALRMVEWHKFAEKPMLAYRNQKIATEGEDAGSSVIVPVDQLNPDSLIVSCKLFAEAPTDFAQRLNAAILMNEKLKVPRSDVLESLGKENAKLLYEQWVQEQYDDSTVGLDIQMEGAKAQMALQMQAQQAMQGQQPPEVPEGGGYPSNTQGVDTGVPAGQGFNPNAGGMSPATGNPGTSLREQVSGTDNTGAQVAV